MISAQIELLKLRKECRYLRIKTATLERAHLAQKQKSDRLEELLKERDKFIKELEREKEALGKLIEELKRQREVYKGIARKLPLNHQSCWAHLVRKSREAISQPHAGEEVKLLHQELKQIFEELTAAVEVPFEQKKRELAYGYFRNKISIIISRQYISDDAVKIQTRIRNQNNNLLTALLYENVSLTNNLAERLIRPMVVTRKISGGSRSDNGAEIHAVNMSIIQTVKMRNQPLIPTLQGYILKAVFGEG